jgi:hypothetical protein
MSLVVRSLAICVGVACWPISSRRSARLMADERTYQDPFNPHRCIVVKGIHREIGSVPHCTPAPRDYGLPAESTAEAFIAKLRADIEESRRARGADVKTGLPIVRRRAREAAAAAAGGVAAEHKRVSRLAKRR